ncbi:hypothetical protein D3C72_144460 [compost metagenome]
MECPFCRKDIGLPSTRDIADGCMYCKNKITYGFDWKWMARMAIPAAIICGLLYLYDENIDSVIFLFLFNLLTVVPSIRIKKMF